MPSCLGIYIEEHLIKYAKVSKEHENKQNLNLIVQIKDITQMYLKEDMQ